MTESASSSGSALEPAPVSRLDRFAARYRQDHRNPVNHFLHVAVGWPIMAAAVVLAPFRPLWALSLFATSYTIMWAGHFLFERNLPTVFKEPSTPFVMAWAVARGLWSSFMRLATPGRVR
jgi:hypothetical protein